MTAETRQHPPADALAAYAAGRLDGPTTAEVEDHLAGCADCSSTIDALPADDFLTSLRDAHALTAADDAVLPDALRDHPRYRVTGLLGRGGMGTVYRAEHLLMGRTVALKVISPRLLAQPGAAERFRHEVRAAARLTHRNIVPAYDAEQVGPLTVLVMEFVEGQSLAERLRERGPLPPAEACAYARQAAEGLAYAHAAGMVHRDIKPHNLMLAADGTIKILDFGLSRFVSGEPSEAAIAETLELSAGSSRTDGLTGSGALMGTLDYMAPEQARDPRSADARSDIYALGATLYHMLSGQLPFPGSGRVEKLMRLAAESPPSLDVLCPGLSPKLVALVGRMMAKRPEDRPQSAAAVAAALAPFAVGRRPARPWLVALAAAAILFVVGTVVVRLKTDRGEVTVETDDPDIVLTASPAGSLVRIEDKKSGKSWSLDARNYRLAQADAPDGLTLDLDDAGPVTLRRGETAIVTVRRNIFGSGAKVVPVSVIPDSLTVFGRDVPPAHAVAVAPDGRLAVSCPGPTITGDRNFTPATDIDPRLWDLATGREVARFAGLHSHASSAAFSPDGRYVAVACGNDRAVHIWEVASRRLVRSLPHGGPEHESGPVGVAWFPDGRRLISSGWDGAIRVFDVGADKEVAQMTFKRSWEYRWSRVAIASDGKTVAASGWLFAATFDATTGKTIKRFEVPGLEWGRILGLAFSPDGRWLVTGIGESPRDATLRLWDTSTGKIERELCKHDDFLSEAAFMPDGKRVVSVGWDGVVRITNVADGTEAARHALGAIAISLAITPDGKHALVGCSDSTIRVVRLPGP